MSLCMCASSMRERERDLYTHNRQANPFAYLEVLLDEIFKLVEIASWIRREVLMSGNNIHEKDNI